VWCEEKGICITPFDSASCTDVILGEGQGGVCPTPAPTWSPTAAPTVAPTPNPTAVPTALPTPQPSLSPTAMPTFLPTLSPTMAPPPTLAPTAMTLAPSLAPTSAPTPSPSSAGSSSPLPDFLQGTSLVVLLVSLSVLLLASILAAVAGRAVRRTRRAYAVNATRMTSGHRDRDRGTDGAPGGLHFETNATLAGGAALPAGQSGAVRQRKGAEARRRQIVDKSAVAPGGAAGNGSGSDGSPTPNLRYVPAPSAPTGASSRGKSKKATLRRAAAAAADANESGKDGAVDSTVSMFPTHALGSEGGSSDTPIVLHHATDDNYGPVGSLYPTESTSGSGIYLALPLKPASEPDNEFPYETVQQHYGAVRSIRGSRLGSRQASSTRTATPPGSRVSRRSRTSSPHSPAATGSSDSLRQYRGVPSRPRVSATSPAPPTATSHYGRPPQPGEVHDTYGPVGDVERTESDSLSTTSESDNDGDFVVNVGSLTESESESDGAGLETFIVETVSASDSADEDSEGNGRPRVHRVVHTPAPSGRSTQYLTASNVVVVQGDDFEEPELAEAAAAAARATPQRRSVATSGTRASNASPVASEGGRRRKKKKKKKEEQ